MVPFHKHGVHAGGKIEREEETEMEGDGTRARGDEGESGGRRHWQRPFEQAAYDALWTKSRNGCPECSYDKTVVKLTARDIPRKILLHPDSFLVGRQTT